MAGLIKDICKKCICESTLPIYVWRVLSDGRSTGLKTKKLCGWNSLGKNDDDLWNDGYVRCKFAGQQIWIKATSSEHIKIFVISNDFIPQGCPYRLEHMMMDKDAE